MKGRNHIILCNSEVQEAMQDYLDKAFAQSPGEVISVSKNAESGNVISLDICFEEHTNESV